MEKRKKGKIILGRRPEPGADQKGGSTPRAQSSANGPWVRQESGPGGVFPCVTRCKVLKTGSLNRMTDSNRRLRGLEGKVRENWGATNGNQGALTWVSIFYGKVAVVDGRESTQITESH